jgi:hypothetical protein
VAAVRIASAARPVTATGSIKAANAVTVDPPAGTRAAVMHTSNPKLVVVWLY